MLVNLMDGEILAESEEGKGSTFRFTILTEVNLRNQADFGETGRSAAYELPSLQKYMNILVAEDNSSNQKVLLHMLKRIGYRADVVADGRKVLEALKRQPYDLILMDIKMPEMDGIAVSKEIRKLWPDNGPKIVAITAFAMDGDKEMCLEAGMDGYIAKPVKMEDLQAILCNLSKNNI
jgi:CheY-like chemotaxis protein